MQKFFGWWWVLLAIVTVLYVGYLIIESILKKNGRFYADGRNVVLEEIIVWFFALILSIGGHCANRYDRMITSFNNVREKMTRRLSPLNTTMPDRDDFGGKT